MADPHDLEAGDTCYYNDQECEVVRGYNGLNMRIQEPGADVQTIIDPRGVTHPDDYEPPEPELDEEVDADELVQELEESTDTEDDDDGADGVSEEGEDDEDDKEPESEEDESDDEGEYVCEDCGQSFDSPQALAGHSSQHSDDEE